MARPFRRRFEQGERPPRERDIADIRKGDKMLAPLIAKIEAGDMADITTWLRASPLSGAMNTTRTLAMMRLNKAGLDRATIEACRDLLR